MQTSCRFSRMKQYLPSISRNCLPSLGMLIIKVNYRRDSSFPHIEVHRGLLTPYLTMVCTIKEFIFTAKLVRHMMVQLSWWATYPACRNKFHECIHSVPSLILKSHSIKSDFATKRLCYQKKQYTHIFPKTCWPFIISLTPTVHSCP